LGWFSSELMKVLDA